MEKLPAKLISKFDASTIRFETEIINRMKLFDFSKSAILHFSEFQKKELQGYSFENLQNHFKLVGFKEGSAVKTISYKNVVNVGESFIEAELSDSIFVLNMATFEHWLTWTLKALILSNPRQFYPKGKKQVEIDYLKKFHDIAMLWEELIDDYLSALPYQGMRVLLKTFLGCFGLKETDLTKNLVGIINEISQRRNVIIRNQTRANAIYVRKSGKYTRFSEGECVIITEEALFEQADGLLRFMQDFRNNCEKEKQTL